MNLNQNLKLEKSVTRKSTRQGFGDALLYLADLNKDILVLTADLPSSTKTKEFAELYPSRFFNMGVAESNMAGVAAGLALSGKIPYITSFGVFSPGLNWGQIRLSIAYSNANVKIASTHTGLGVGEDGASHQSLEDIALMRVMPNMVVFSPADYEEAFKATVAAAEISRPVYIRLGRQDVLSVTTRDTPFKIGEAYKYTQGTDVTIFSTGSVMEFCLDAVIQLEKKGISVDLINVPTIKPLDITMIVDSVKKTKCAVTVEDHQKMGGFGSAIAEVTTERYPVPINFVGMDDSFGESGPFMDLYKKYGIYTDNIIKKVLNVIERK